MKLIRRIKNKLHETIKPCISYKQTSCTDTLDRTGRMLDPPGITMTVYVRWSHAGPPRYYRDCLRTLHSQAVVEAKTNFVPN